MKKAVMIGTMIMALAMQVTVFAGDMEVQVIGGPDVDSSPVSLDDIKLESNIDIDGYATINPTSFEYVDFLNSYREGRHDCEWGQWDSYQSGNDADYALLRMDIINLNTKGKNFLENCDVKVVFDDTYEYGGWFYQYNYDNGTISSNPFANEQNVNIVIKDVDNFTIDPMYAGHYCFGATLPNAVVNSKKPLAMTITIDGNEITYNIRK